MAEDGYPVEIEYWPLGEVKLKTKCAALTAAVGGGGSATLAIAYLNAGKSLGHALEVTFAKCDPETGDTTVGLSDPNNPSRFYMAVFGCDNNLKSLEPQHPFIPSAARVYRLLIETPLD